ncbi:hypothetical protein [Streptomyces sp. YIM S03343]
MNPQYDVVIVGGGVAGALTACRIKTVKPNARILLLDAGSNGTAKPDRDAFVAAYQTAAIKNVPSPYAGLDNNRLGYAPSSDGTPDPVAMNRYYVEDGPNLYESGFQRMLGGSTWAWRGNTPRFLPNDFRLKTKYGVGADWPITYADLEPYYVQAEAELGVSGNDDEWVGLTPRSAPYPMPGIAPSYGWPASTESPGPRDRSSRPTRSTRLRQGLRLSVAPGVAPRGALAVARPAGVPGAAQVTIPFYRGRPADIPVAAALPMFPG